MNEALNFLYCFIGVNRCGKSVVAHKLAKAWKLANPGDLVVSHDPQRRFTDLTDIKILPSDKDWAKKCLKLRNVLIILDDMRLINEKNTPVEGLSDLLYFRADYNISIITIFHNPSLVLNAVSGFVTHYFIFLTNAREGSFKAKIPNYSLCVAASAEVNKYVSVFGRGSYPIFPYVIVDSDRQKLIAVNMEKNISKIK